VRLDEFKVLTEAAADNIVTVGDSHAVAIGRAGGFQNFAVNGASVAGIASQVRSVPNGSFVILSAGNNDVSRNPGSVVTDVQNIVRQLQAKDCKVVLVLFPDINLTGPSKAVYDRARYTANYNAVRDALKRVTADGKLELRNSDINPQDPMRIHATTGAYKRIADTVKLGAGGADDASKSTPASLRAGDTGMSKEDLRKIYLSSPDSSFFGLFNATNAIVNLDPEDVAAQVENQKAVAQGVGSAGAATATTTAANAPAARGAAQDPNAAVRGVLDLIGKYESGNDYNRLNGTGRKPLVNMTLQQVMDEQRNFRTWPGATSSAIGKYQYISSTLREMIALMGLNPQTTKYDARTQDAIAKRDLQRRCRLDDWLAGRITDAQFMNLVARVWASVPTTAGVSAYQGVGNNAAGVSSSSALNQLASIRGAGTATA
jgi:hypothetical protein